MDALISDVNARGGVLGARVRLVPHEVSVGEAAQDPAVTAQKTCERLTRDDPVDVVLSTVAPINIPTLFACLSRTRTPVVLLDPNPHSLGQEFERFRGLVYHPATIATERLAPVWIDRLAAQAWFGGWDTDSGRPAHAPARTGILHQSGNEFFLQSVSAALAAQQQDAPEAIEYSDFSDAAQKMPAFAFQLRARGVTHVFVDKPVTLILFLKAALAQNYYPRLAITTNHGPSAVLVDEAAPRQLRGSAGVGFLPLADVPDSTRLPSYSAESPALRCDRLHRRAAVPAGSQLALLVQRLNCDAVWLLERGYSSGGRLTAEALRQGLSARQAAVPGAAAEQVVFGPDRFDGAALVRDLRFDTHTGQFVYSSGPAPVR